MSITLYKELIHFSLYNFFLFLKYKSTFTSHLIFFLLITELSLLICRVSLSRLFVIGISRYLLALKLSKFMSWICNIRFFFFEPAYFKIITILTLKISWDYLFLLILCKYHIKNPMLFNFINQLLYLFYITSIQVTSF